MFENDGYKTLSYKFDYCNYLLELMFPKSLLNAQDKFLTNPVEKKKSNS